MIPGPELLSAFKVAHGLSDAALAERIGTTDVAVLRWRKGEWRPNPGFRTAIRIATTVVDSDGCVLSEGIPESAWDLDGSEAAAAGRARQFVAHR